MLRACRYTDEVIAQTNRDKIEAFERLHFDVMFVGDDWKDNELFITTEQYLNQHGANVVYFPYTQSVSSTILRTRLQQNGILNGTD
jgi:glycerol-3-phosphate cytidylyltransferase